MKDVFGEHTHNVFVICLFSYFINNLDKRY